ncbi:uncharacterized protein LOC118465650 [Anopheles albimanus]|uniref:Spaetzle domain-containing protein n=1 Tax=Anopheles albimanus TaxID=7167 RepID=A0A1Y9G8D8_ANOAL|nr:uncharacterized protein LOC118465650 [Anopheles albimanus]
MRLARVSVKVQGAGVCVLLACLLHSAVVHSSENAPPTPQEERSGVLEQSDPLVEPEPHETEGLGLEARMALPEADPQTGAPVYPASRQAMSKSYALRVLQFENSVSTKPVASRSYSQEYPTAKIMNALIKDGRRYKDVFASTIIRRPIDDDASKNATKEFMCRSTVSQQYPTYDSETKGFIVNVEGFYQGITYDECDEPGAACNNDCSSTTSDFRCEQRYDTVDVVVAHVGGNDREATLSLARIHYPSSCKCRRKDLIAEN